MSEDNTQVKISMPLIDDIELQRIDNFYNDIVSEYTKAFVKEKEQVIIQRLMKNLQQENQQLKDRINQYENPDDLTLFYMWLDEKAKDKIKELRNKNSILMENLIRSKTKYNNDKARYRKKAKMYRERINKAVEYIEDKLKIYPEGLVGKHLGQEFLKDISDLLKGDKE